MKKLKGRSCYYCGAAATSRDHVPPRAFFPEEKDRPANSPSYRKNLVTVPSCDTHNSELSGDDQIAAYAVLALRDVNAEALHHQATKAHRAMTKDPTLARRVLLRIRHAVDESGKEGLIATIDPVALDRVLERTARGLHFYDFETRWTAKLKIVSDALMMASDQTRPFEEAVRGVRLAMAHLPWRGANPEVFRWQWFSFRDSVTKVLRMLFYADNRHGGFEFVAVPLNDGPSAERAPRPIRR